MRHSQPIYPKHTGNVFYLWIGIFLCTVGWSVAGSEEERKGGGYHESEQKSCDGSTLGNGKWKGVRDLNEDFDRQL